MMGFGELCVVALIGLASGWLVLSIAALRRGDSRRAWLNLVAAGAMEIIAGAAVVESGSRWMWALGTAALTLGVVLSLVAVRRSKPSEALR